MNDAVAKRPNAAVCKTAIRGFDSHPNLKEKEAYKAQTNEKYLVDSKSTIPEWVNRFSMYIT